MQFSLRFLVAAVAVAAAFFAGWILPPPESYRDQTPVLIANRDIGHWKTLSNSDFRQVYMKAKDVPDLAARDFSQVSGHRTDLRIRSGGMVFVDELLGDQVLLNFGCPPGKKVINIEMPDDFDELAWYALRETDEISLSFISQDKSEQCISLRCTIFHKSSRPSWKPDNSKMRIIGVWLTEEEATKLKSARDNGMNILIGPPDEAREKS